MHAPPPPPHSNNPSKRRQCAHMGPRHWPYRIKYALRVGLAARSQARVSMPNASATPAHPPRPPPPHAHIPDSERKSGIPADTLIPAPVTTSMRRLWATRRATLAKEDVLSSSPCMGGPTSRVPHHAHDARHEVCAARCPQRGCGACANPCTRACRSSRAHEQRRREGGTRCTWCPARVAGGR